MFCYSMLDISLSKTFKGDGLFDGKFATTPPKVAFSNCSSTTLSDWADHLKKLRLKTVYLADLDYLNLNDLLDRLLLDLLKIFDW